MSANIKTLEQKRHSKKSWKTKPCTDISRVKRNTTKTPPSMVKDAVESCRITKNVTNAIAMSAAANSLVRITVSQTVDPLTTKDVSPPSLVP